MEQLIYLIGISIIAAIAILAHFIYEEKINEEIKQTKNKINNK